MEGYRRIQTREDYETEGGENIMSEYQIMRKVKKTLLEMVAEHEIYNKQYKKTNRILYIANENYEEGLKHAIKLLSIYC